MVAATPVNPYPHPAFPEALLPEKIRAELQRDPKRHYPPRYLDQLKAMDSAPSTGVEKFAKLLVSGILAFSLIAARADILWIGNSQLLNLSASRKHRKQTVWLRRILLLEALAECHGMASGLLHHFETILFNQISAAPHSMVYALVAEFDCHRTHLATFQAIAKPNLLTRVVLLSSQLARFTAEAAARVYLDLGKDIDAGQVPDIASAKVPPATRLFYVLADNSNMRQVCKCIQADDEFLAKWEDSATWHHHNAVAHMYAN